MPTSDGLLDWGMVLSQMAPQSPIFVLWIIGIILALAFWRRHPMVSLLSLFAFLTFFFSAIVGTLVYAYVWQQFRNNGWRGDEMSRYGNIIYLFRSALNALAWAMLLVALFGWRRLPTSGLGGAFARVDSPREEGYREDR